MISTGLMARNMENPRFFKDGCWKNQHSQANSMGKATGRRWDQRDAGHGDEQKGKEGKKGKPKKGNAKKIKT